VIEGIKMEGIKMWWVVLAEDGHGYEIVHAVKEPEYRVRGPFRFFTDAEEWRDWWMRKEEGKFEVWAYLMGAWAIIGLSIVVYWITG